jgi:hypothetical protein
MLTQVLPALEALLAREQTSLDGEHGLVVGVTYCTRCSTKGLDAMGQHAMLRSFLDARVVRVDEVSALPFGAMRTYFFVLRERKRPAPPLQWPRLCDKCGSTAHAASHCPEVKYEGLRCSLAGGDAPDEAAVAGGEVAAASVLAQCATTCTAVGLAQGRRVELDKGAHVYTYFPERGEPAAVRVSVTALLGEHGTQRWLRLARACNADALRLACSKGTAAHAAIEQALTRGAIDEGHEHTDAVREAVAFISQFVRCGYELVCVEQPLLWLRDGNPVTAGTPDAVLRRGNKYVVVDWKRSRRLKGSGSTPLAHPLDLHTERDAYALQVSAYALMLQQTVPGADVAAYVVSVLPGEAAWVKVDVADYAPGLERVLEREAVGERASPRAPPARKTPPAGSWRAPGASATEAHGNAEVTRRLRDLGAAEAAASLSPAYYHQYVAYDARACEHAGYTPDGALADVVAELDASGLLAQALADDNPVHIDGCGQLSALRRTAAQLASVGSLRRARVVGTDLFADDAPHSGPAEPAPSGPPAELRIKRYDAGRERPAGGDKFALTICNRAVFNATQADLDARLAAVHDSTAPGGLFVLLQTREFNPRIPALAANYLHDKGGWRLVLHEQQLIGAVSADRSPAAETTVLVMQKEATTGGGEGSGWPSVALPSRPSYAVVTEDDRAFGVVYCIFGGYVGSTCTAAMTRGEADAPFAGGAPRLRAHHRALRQNIHANYKVQAHFDQGVGRHAGSTEDRGRLLEPPLEAQELLRLERHEGESVPSLITRVHDAETSHIAAERHGRARLNIAMLAGGMDAVSPYEGLSWAERARLLEAAREAFEAWCVRTPLDAPPARAATEQPSPRSAGTVAAAATCPDSC